MRDTENSENIGNLIKPRNRFRLSIGVLAISLFLFTSRSDAACPAPRLGPGPGPTTQCYSDVNGAIGHNPAGTRQACCCTDWLWPILGYASRNACLFSYFPTALSYGPTAPAPTTCQHIGLIPDVTPSACPGPRCTRIEVGTTACICPGATETWSKGECIPPGPITGPCLTALPPSGAWNAHACARSGCSSSVIPAPNAVLGVPQRIPPGIDFDDLVNPMAACCGTGWGENGYGAQKFDCVEAVPNPLASPTPTYQTFLDFYNQGATANALATAGVVYPNRMFVISDSGEPLNGFYTDKGARCPLAPQLTAADQLELYDDAIANQSAPTAAATWSPAARVSSESCCNLVLFALERQCPTVDAINGIQVATTSGAVRRCTAAASMRLHYALIDLCDPRVVKRGRFKEATTFPSADPKYTLKYPTDPLTTRRLVSAFYQRSPDPVAPLPKSPPCPNSPAIRHIPWTTNTCELNLPP